MLEVPRGTTGRAGSYELIEVGRPAWFVGRDHPVDHEPMGAVSSFRRVDLPRQPGWKGIPLVAPQVFELEVAPPRGVPP